MEQLRESLKALAETPENQILHLIDVGLIDRSEPLDELLNIDELALQFEDAKCLVNTLVVNGSLSAEAVKCIEDLNGYLLAFSDKENADFWTIKALRHDARWARVRELARASLSKVC